MIPFPESRWYISGTIFSPETPWSVLSLSNKCLISNGAGRGDRTPMGLHPKVFEFYADQASTVTIGHTLILFSNLSGST